MSIVRNFSPATGTDRFERHLIIYLVFAFASGALAHLLPAVLPVTRSITDVLLLLQNGLIIFVIYRRNEDPSLLWWLAFAYVFTFAAEAVGVASGAIFGEYAYGPTMWVQWLGVPFVIALNWCVLTLACNDLVLRLLGKPKTNAPAFLLRSLFAALAAGVLAAVYDVVIEPVAIALEWWDWAAAEIPLQNYFAWAVIAFFVSLPLHLLKIKFASPVLPVYFIAQLLFFVVLNLFL